eukprot:scaffold178183_cov34-Prasinocladus_malaysianus.AAC.1
MQSHPPFRIAVIASAVVSQSEFKEPSPQFVQICGKGASRMKKPWLRWMYFQLSLHRKQLNFVQKRYYME